MKKKFFMIAILLFVFPITCYASTDYTIDKYKVEITIDKDNNYEITENVDVSFRKIDAVIKREMPYNIKNLDVNAEYSMVTTDKRLLTINSDRGKVNESYKFNYVLTNGSDKNSYDIDIRNTFDSSIMKSSFVITLPSSVTSDNISFLYEDEEIVDGLEYKIKGNRIEGTFNKGLIKGDKITLKVKYKQVYFNYLNCSIIVLPIILAFISYFIWKRYGKDLKYNVIKSFVLPKELTPLDVALVNNEKVVADDVFAFLIYLANKGYIKIGEEKNNEFYLERVKDYDGDNYQEEIFIKALFRKNIKVTLAEYIDLVSSKKQIEKEEALENRISSSDLNYRYKRALNNLLPMANNNEEKSIYYELESDKKKYILVAFVAIILTLVTLIPFIEVNQLYLFPLSIIYSIIALKILVAATDYINLDDLLQKKKRVYVILSSILIVLVCVIILVPSFKRNLIYTLAFLISFISVIFILVLYKYMSKKTVYGSKIYSKIKGLKTFVETCDKNNLLKALKKDKNYLYNLLSYSYVLGINNKVFTLFKEVEVKQPNWYVLKDEFTINKFNNSLNRLKTILNKINEELN